MYFCFSIGYLFFVLRDPNVGQYKRGGLLLKPCFLHLGSVTPKSSLLASAHWDTRGVFRQHLDIFPCRRTYWQSHGAALRAHALSLGHKLSGHQEGATPWAQRETPGKYGKDFVLPLRLLPSRRNVMREHFEKPALFPVSPPHTHTHYHHPTPSPTLSRHSNPLPALLINFKISIWQIPNWVKLWP